VKPNERTLGGDNLFKVTDDEPKKKRKRNKKKEADDDADMNEDNEDGMEFDSSNAKVDYLKFSVRL